MNYSEKSYLAHKEHFAVDLTDPHRIKIGETWFREDTANHWVHQRMYEGAHHLLKDPNKTWVTVGDGRYGLDSIVLKRKGWKQVLPTDISESLLKSAFEKGIISEYKVENAESLSFQDNQFDYLLCKESYHHFPRPMIALYEMLRVTKEAVLLIEPHDTVHSFSLHGILRKLKRKLKKILFSNDQHIDAGRYEDSTNYIYAVTSRELEKAAIGLNYSFLAFKGLNDSYEAGCEFEPASFQSKMYRRMRIRCWKDNLLCRLGIKDYSMLMSLIFKNEPDTVILNELRKNGWSVVKLPKNPYI